MDMMTFLKKMTDIAMVKGKVPYYFQEGRIKGKYVMKRTMSKSSGKKIYNKYANHIKRNLRVGRVSLADYLRTAYICYKSSMKSVNGLDAAEAYNRYADKRHGGMLDIKDKRSTKEFHEWLHSGKWAGSHPFEIVFSWRNHGILLYPPMVSTDKGDAYYKLYLGNMAYAGVYIKMVISLIKKNVDFEAPDLGGVLAYLTGEGYFRVNEFEEHFVFYEDIKKSYRKYVEWDELGIALPKHAKTLR